MSTPIETPSPDEPERSRTTNVIWIVAGAAAIVIILLRMVLGGAQSLTPLPIISTVPTFELTDQNAAPYGTKELRGKPWIASFVYSTCPGPCPLVVQRLGDIKRRLSDDPRMMIVSITVDPEGDTPEVLKIYGKTHAIDPSRWRLLTGPYNQVLNLVQKGFYLPIAENEGADPKLIAEQGPITHSTKLVLIDAELQIRGYYDSDDANDLKQLTADTKRLLSRSGT
jgi:protein SCO1/2